jgi:hypothetical protein
VGKDGEASKYQVTHGMTDEGDVVKSERVETAIKE